MAQACGAGMEATDKSSAKKERSEVAQERVGSRPITCASGGVREGGQEGDDPLVVGGGAGIDFEV